MISPPAVSVLIVVALVPMARAYTCPTGQVALSDQTSTCGTGQDPCSASDCCEADDICYNLGMTGSNPASCGVGKTMRMSMTSLITAATNSTFETACCVTYSACSLSDCSYGYKLKDPLPEDTAATGQGCCEVDTLKCGSVPSNAQNAWCPNDMYFDADGMSVKADNLKATAANCCSSMATCSTFTCPPGTETKTGTDGTTTCGGATCGFDHCCQVSAGYDKCFNSGASCTGSSVVTGAHVYVQNTSTAAEEATACCIAPYTCATTNNPAGGVGTTSSSFQKKLSVAIASLVAAATALVFLQ